MSGTLEIVQAGPAMSLQDLGRTGAIARGLSVGGAADRRALYEAAALLGLSAPVAAIEMAGAGGSFRTDVPLRFALTGAPMRAEIDGRALRWNASHRLAPGETLRLGGVTSGVYGYLTPAGGFVPGPDRAAVLGALSAHLAAGIGALLQAGERLALGPDRAPDSPALVLPAERRLGEATLRLMPGPQTPLFSAGTRARFFATRFVRGAQANRQGVELTHEGAPFETEGGRRLASDFITPGDVQMTGAGEPYVLLSECQSMGGYPRLGTVIAADLPALAQVPLGAGLRFTALTVEQADRLWSDETRWLIEARAQARPLVRDPRDMPDLLSYELISGVTAGDDLERS